MDFEIEREDSDEAFLHAVKARWGWIRSVRPLALAALFARVLPPSDRRRVFRTRDDLQLLVDPLACLGTSCWPTVNSNPTTSH